MIPRLRDYQLEIIAQSRSAIRRGKRAILHVLPTGSGKTVIFASMIAAAVERGYRCWVLTHRNEIRSQTVNKLFDFGIQTGQIAAGQPISNNPAQVCGVRTLVNKLSLLDTFDLRPDLIVVDEAHHAVASTWVKILERFPKCVNLGFTATPQRLDGRGLVDIYDHMIEGVSTAWLVDNNFLCEPAVFSSPLALEVKNKKYRTKNREFNLDQQTEFMGERRLVNEMVDMYEKFFNGAPAIIFCPSIDDCELVADNMRQAGWRCVVVKAGMDADLRRDYIEGLGTGVYNAVCSYEVISEGVDVPVLAGVIMRRRTKSLTIYLQQVGRALRTAPGKSRALIIDQCGNYFLHGHPLQSHTWSLESADKKPSVSRINIFECPNPLCRAVLREQPQKCPYCGLIFARINDAESEEEIKIIYDELKEMKAPAVNAGSLGVAKNLYPGVSSNELIGDQKSKTSADSIYARWKVLTNALNRGDSWTARTWDRYVLSTLTS